MVNTTRQLQAKTTNEENGISRRLRVGKSSRRAAGEDKDIRYIIYTKCVSDDHYYIGNPVPCADHYCFGICKECGLSSFPQNEIKKFNPPEKKYWNRGRINSITAFATAIRDNCRRVLDDVCFQYEIHSAAMRRLGICDELPNLPDNYVRRMYLAEDKSFAKEFSSLFYEPKRPPYELPPRYQACSIDIDPPAIEHDMIPDSETHNEGCSDIVDFRCSTETEVSRLPDAEAGSVLTIDPCIEYHPTSSPKGLELYVTGCFAIRVECAKILEYKIQISLLEAMSWISISKIGHSFYYSSDAEFPFDPGTDLSLLHS